MNPNAGTTATREAPLTSREVEVLWWLARGCTYSRIGERLGVSLHTVTTHIKSIYRKLDVHSAGAAVMRAVDLQVLVSKEEEEAKN